MNQPQNNPLDGTDIQEVMKALQIVGQAQRECVRAANCGFDTQAHNMIAEALRTRLEAIIHHYGAQRRDG